MSLLGDIVGEIVGGAIFDGIGEFVRDLSPRVRHTLTGLGGAALAGGVGSVMVMWPATDRPGWTIGLTVVSLLYGLGFGAVSLVTLVDPYDRRFALFALLACASAAVLPLILMAS
jgi:hypothetical protein